MADLTMPVFVTYVACLDKLEPRSGYKQLSGDALKIDIDILPPCVKYYVILDAGTLFVTVYFF